MVNTSRLAETAASLRHLRFARPEDAGLGSKLGLRQRLGFYTVSFPFGDSHAQH